MATRRIERFLWSALALLGAAVGQAAPALQPFLATYNVEWRGLSAGTSTLELVQQEGNTYTYRSRNAARGIFRIALPGTITQTSTFDLVDGRVVPRRYSADDGTRSTERDVELEFDWNAGRITGVSEEKPVDLPLEPGTLDALSVQIALMSALQSGSSPSSFRLVDDGEIKEYIYTREGTETLKTPLGTHETVIYSSHREGSSRVTRFWIDPELGYLPVRAEQRRRGKVEFTMTLRALERSAAASTARN
ncbi:MAG: DUF3108 domain-containing protein [Pseudomonadota bacterium]